MQDIFNDISKVLSLFDEEDIKYIIAKQYLEYLKEIKSIEKIHIKKLGETNESKRRNIME